ncbi:MAG: MFS transporter [Gammaproteobacteria bacterium CG11_big_fil_rev_8_21_14_0_20_46_22]|nr:MAG: MFS transporter [Gammaproteobacteria bacterium CG12_big_fil_rev_8_21_14_0_65_46_12]PIR10153.1 MAG: MFS transporter [Gammaproteobacteria bacterium CG11_big_fil_rev_8_21_14_0_20_46_22]
MLGHFYRSLARYAFFPYFICALAASFYLFEFAIRVAPSVMTNELMASFHIQSFGLGALAACFFYVYTPMQIPAGLLVDRFGPRLLLSLMMIICAFGCLVFSHTHSLWLAGIARAMMGFGSAFVYVSILVLISRWCPPKQFAMLTGATQFLGALGAIAGEKPLSWAMHAYGWRSAVEFFFWLGLVMAAMMWLFIRDYAPGRKPLAHKRAPERKHLGMEWKRLKVVLSHPQSWYIGAYGFTCWTAVAIFGTLWGVHYAQTVFNISAEQASGMISVLWIGVAISSPLIGWWSDKIQSRRIPLLASSILGLAGTGVLFFMHDVSLSVAYVCVFLLGFAAGAQSVTFGLVRDINPAYTMGTASGFNNMAVILGAVIFQPLVGHMLGWHWNHAMLHGAPVYAAAAYQHAMSVIPWIFVAGIVLTLFFIKETRCQNVVQPNHHHPFGGQ